MNNINGVRGLGVRRGKEFRAESYAGTDYCAVVFRCVFLSVDFYVTKSEIVVSLVPETAHYVSSSVIDMRSFHNVQAEDIANYTCFEVGTGKEGVCLNFGEFFQQMIVCGCRK